MHDTVIEENVRVLQQSYSAAYHLPSSAYPFQAQSQFTDVQRPPIRPKGTAPAIIGITPTDLLGAIDVGANSLHSCLPGNYIGECLYYYSY